MLGLLSSMATLSEPVFGKPYQDMLLSMCINVLAKALANIPAFYLSGLPSLRLNKSSVRDLQASFATGVCEAEASGHNCKEASLGSSPSSRADEFNAPEEENLVLCKAPNQFMEGPDSAKRIGKKIVSAWISLAKKDKDDDDEDEDEEDNDDEEDGDEAADEEDVDDEKEGESGKQGHQEGDDEDDDGDDDNNEDEDDDDDDDDEDSKGDDEEDGEDGVEGEDEEDEDAAEDEDEEDDDETQEPPRKRRK